MASKPKFFKQVKLMDADQFTTTAWIDMHAAKVGTKMKLLDDEDPDRYWYVVEAYEGMLSAKVLKEKQRMDKASLPSIKG